MATTATAIELEDRFVVLAGSPILDTSEGVLIIAFDDGTSRVFNWDYVIEYYEMTPDEFADWTEYEDGLN